MGVARRFRHGRWVHVPDVWRLRRGATKHYNRCTEGEHRQSEKNEIALHDWHPGFEELTADHIPRRGLLSHQTITPDYFDGSNVVARLRSSLVALLNEFH
jgi:hypothetical protein